MCIGNLMARLAMGLEIILWGRLASLCHGSSGRQGSLSISLIRAREVSCIERWSFRSFVVCECLRFVLNLVHVIISPPPPLYTVQYAIHTLHFPYLQSKSKSRSNHPNFPHHRFPICQENGSVCWVWYVCACARRWGG